MVGRLPRVGEVFGRYRIDAQVGMGGMGVVFAATDTRLGRRVALKVMAGALASDPEFRERFQREAGVLARLDSPHVIRIFDHGEVEGFPFIATQFVGGGDLADLVRSRGGLSLGAAVRVCAQVAEALGDAHRVGVVHRDIKPANVLLRDPDAVELEAFLCDFGIAQTEARGLTVTGGVAGTWPYLAPERVQGAPATPASDVYALGCVFHAVLTGRAPYRGSDVEVAMAHVNAPVPQLPGGDATTAAVNAVLARVLAKDPRDRPASAEELRGWLLGLVPDAGGQVVAPVPVRRGGRRRTPVVAAVATALVLGGLGAGGWWWQQRDTGNNDQAAPPGDPTPSSTGPPVGGVDDAVVLFSDGQVDAGVVGMFPGEDSFERASTDLKSGLLAVRADVDGDAGDGTITVGEVTSDGRGLNVTVTRMGQSALDFRLDLTSELKNRGRKKLFPLDDLALSAGDFDGDGDDDLMVAYDTDRGARVDVAVGEDGELADFTLWRRASERTVGVSFIPGDFDGDGDDDVARVTGGVDALASSVDTKPRIQLLRSDGSGLEAIGEPRLVGTSWLRTISATAGDFDGDGVEEVAVLALVSATADVSVFSAGSDGFGRGHTHTQFGDLRVTSRYYTATLHAGDIDEDGSDDLVAVMPTVAETARELWLLPSPRGDDPDSQLLGSLQHGPSGYAMLLRRHMTS